MTVSKLEEKDMLVPPPAPYRGARSRNMRDSTDVIPCHLFLEILPTPATTPVQSRSHLSPPPAPRLLARSCPLRDTADLTPLHLSRALLSEDVRAHSL